MTQIAWGKLFQMFISNWGDSGNSMVKIGTLGCDIDRGQIMKWNRKAENGN